ncbi:Heat shock protein 70 family [Artemisia annua]|uniref:Heat shock protein 70 family n=1 Tax=Artemisia annua TaxID=35608 RepID=A0A2U1KIW1_ARTAN|nr:Heat shock protein 70 family [Artemisia annua]
MSVVGFDIGNESCVIAAARRGGVVILLNDELKHETPSVVSFGVKQRFFGSAGVASALANPKSSISQVKRLIGRQYKEPSMQKDLMLLPFVTSEGPRGGILIELEYMKEKMMFTPVEILGMLFKYLKQIAEKNLESGVVDCLEYMKEKMMFTPVEILGMLFKYLKQIAEKNLESGVVDCVIGIPSYFTDLQRREYLDAATIAGLKPLTLMHDGTAIALGYGMYKTDLCVEPIVVVFVNIGHSDTQVTVAAFKQGQMKILAHSFDNNLGGRDFDEVIFKHFAAQFDQKYKIDVSSNARASIRLRASCEKVKKVLSVKTEACLNIKCLIKVKDVRGIITRGEFENLSQQLLGRVTIPCLKAVEDSCISVDEIDKIELVGSGSCIPAITKMLTSLFQKEPTRTLDVSECVARGCALRCAMLSPTLKVQDYKVQDIFPYSIGLPADKNKSKREITLFAKGISFPNYRVLKCNKMTPLDIQVFYAIDKNFPAGMSTKVGHFMIDSSQSSGKEKLIFEFVVLLNKNGVVEIDSVSILEDNNRSRKNNNPHSGKMVANGHMSNLAFSENLDVATTKDELHKAQEIEKVLAEQDIKVEQAKDQRNTLESFVYDTRSKLLSTYRSFATDAEKDGITKSLQETKDWLYEDSDDESDEQNYSGKLEELKQLLDPIEKRYKDENARSKATKAFLNCIGEYRSATDLLASGLKHEVNNQCLEAEQWLNRYQQKESSKNMDPIQWSSVMKQATDRFESNCKDIMRPKPSPQKLHELSDSDQRDNLGNSDQSQHLVNSNRRAGAVNLNRRDGPVDLNQRDGPVNSIPKDGLRGWDRIMDLNKWGGLVGFNQKGETAGLNQRDQNMCSNQRGQTVGVYQRDRTMDSKQRDHPLHSVDNMVVNTYSSNDAVDQRLSDLRLTSTSNTNVTRTDRARIKDFGVSENVLGDRRKNKLSEAQVTKQILAEKDIQVEQTKETIRASKALSYHNDEFKEADSGKLGNPVQLSGPVENKNKDEQATKQIQNKLHEAQVTKQMLAEKDIQVEQTEEKIHGSKALSYYNDEYKEAVSGKLGNPVQLSGPVENENKDEIAREQVTKLMLNKLREAQVNKQMPAEKDIQLEQTKEKIHGSELSRPVENKNKDENAREQAIKAMLTCLEEYRLIAGSLPLSQKEEVNIECNRVEQWLNDLSQQNLSNKNINPIRWSNIIKNAMESFERRCKHLMN